MDWNAIFFAVALPVFIFGVIGLVLTFSDGQGSVATYNNRQIGATEQAPLWAICLALSRCLRTKQLPRPTKASKSPLIVQYL
jgi:hypothetical protein